MCGRITLRAPQSQIVEHFRVEAQVAAPRFNLAPTQLTLVLCGQPRRLEAMRWGMASAGGQQLLINARSETAAQKPTFREALRSRRCIVPADGFYEWRHAGGLKEPHFIGLAGDELFGMAGIFQSDGFAVLTTAANELVSELHDRMPVILDPADYDTWLNPATTPEQIAALLRPYPSEAMHSFTVSSRVNSALRDDAECIAPVAPQKLLF